MPIFNDDGMISTISDLQSKYSDVSDQSHQNLSQSLSYHYVDPEEEEDELFYDYDEEELSVDSDWISGFGKLSRKPRRNRHAEPQKNRHAGLLRNRSRSL